MTAHVVRLKHLLRERHWQVYRTFCAEYDKAAKAIDPELTGTWPSRAQLHRWVSGELLSLPYPDHCRILETMFPGWSAAQLFEPITPEQAAVPASSEASRLFDEIGIGLATPEAPRSSWGAVQAPRNGAPVGRAASLNSHITEEPQDITQRIGRKLLALSQSLRLTDDETRQLASLAGNIVDLECAVDLDIAGDGNAQVTYRHEIFNMSDRPVSRVARELWFEFTSGPLQISPTAHGRHRVAIQRLHDTSTLAKFAVQLSPAVQPGESAVFGYTCQGGKFVTSWYWRQGTPRFTRHLTINLRQRGSDHLASCSATEEFGDGSERSASESLIWDMEGSDVTVMLTCDYLRPNQAVTLRWEIPRAVA